MKKFFSKIIIGGLFITTLGVFVGSGTLLHPQVAYASADTLGTCTLSASGQSMPNMMKQADCLHLDPNAIWVADPGGRIDEKTAPRTGGGCGITNLTSCILLVPGYIASYVILPLVGWITTLSGLLLNYIVDLTIVHMRENIAKANINDTWSTVRDVANMFFIFVLLYTAIMTMFGKGDYKRTISNLVIAAIFINFSLFFTKVIIDAGNLLALTFYNAIVAPGASITGASHFDTGISNALMNQLHIASIWNSTGGLIDGTKLVTIGVMGSIVALIAAFVFLTISIMFVIRFVVLIFVLILSPLMFAGLILPNMKKVGSQWWDALIGQTFFAPIYFFMMWIVIKLSRGLFAGTTGEMSDALGNSYSATHQLLVTDSTFGVLINFVMIIAFLILALVISKNYSNKAGPMVSGMTKWASGLAGGATMGLAGRFGRGTVGRFAQAKADDQSLIDRAAAGSMTARLQLAAARKTAGASFDARNTALAKPLGTGVGQNKGKGGGFAQDIKDKVEAEKKKADSFKPSDLATYQVEQEAQEIEKETATPALTEKLEKESAAEAKRLKKHIEKLKNNKANYAARGASHDELKEMDKQILLAERDYAATDTLKSYTKSKVDQLKGVDEKAAKERAAEQLGLGTDVKALDERIKNGTPEQKKEALDTIESHKRDNAENARKITYARGLQEQRTLGEKFDIFGRILGAAGVKKEYSAAAVEIRKSTKNKSAKDKLAEAAEALAKENKAAEDATAAAATGGTTPPPAPAGGTPPPTA